MNEELDRMSKHEKCFGFERIETHESEVKDADRRELQPIF